MRELIKIIKRDKVSACDNARVAELDEAFAAAVVNVLWWLTASTKIEINKLF
jgi:hypothetical protein